MADGTLIFETKLDTKGLQTGLKSVDDKLKGLQKTATLGLGAIASGLIAAGTAGVKFNAQMEQYTATFETFTGSAEEATETMDRLLELGASTPFETTELADATQLLMAYGFTADEAVNSLTMLGDASQGNAEKLTSIATGFARMKSSGKVTLEYLNLMIENGFNPLNQVAEDTGMTMAEVYDAISAGEITFEQVQSAMEKMTSEGGQYFGLMEKQSQTLNGRLSTLSDTVQMKLGEAFQAVSDKITELLPLVIDFVENIDVKQAVQAIIALSSALAGVLGVITTLRGSIALFNVVSKVNEIGGIAKVVANLSANLATFASTLAPVIATAGAVVAVIALIGTAMYQLWNENEYFAESIINIIYGLQDIFTDLYEAFIEPVIENIISLLMALYENAIMPLWDAFKQFIFEIVTGFSELIDAIMPFVEFLVEYVAPIVTEFLNMFATNFILAIQNIIMWFTSLLSSISLAIDGLFEMLNGIITFLTGIFTGNWQKAWNGLVQFVGGAFKTLVGLVKAPLNTVIALVNKAIEAINSISFTVPDWVPSWLGGGQTFSPNLPTIPYLAKGGVLKRGQVGLLEGSGAEAVVPLEKNKAWISAVAKDFAQIMPSVANTNQTVNFYQTVETPDEMARALRMQQRYGLAG